MECRKNPQYEKLHGVDVVICRVCGKKLTSELRARYGGHVSAHRMTMEAYREKYPGVPYRSEAQAKLQKAAGQRHRVKRNSELERLRALARVQKKKRPGPTPGTSYKTEEKKTWFIIGQKVERLIRADQKNDDLAKRIARRAVEQELAGKYEAGMVAKYHERFRRFRAKQQTPGPKVPPR